MDVTITTYPIGFIINTIYNADDIEITAVKMNGDAYKMVLLIYHINIGNNEQRGTYSAKTFTYMHTHTHTHTQATPTRLSNDIQ